ncbi:hypothetical protein [Pseudoroseicyclus tamaricis]|uniref:Uncharacterized protein n=1 Tax=Pseudoroseicyclus tamaricis TaxID=2705421 RepID=A0A6B2JNS5_9RHOB|nr:hypothetical protein [Pseudoroseicyclus tamaricis]NDU99584.1 hypothetical protein [Pseudoroseicyclus tamaricis]
MIRLMLFVFLIALVAVCALAALVLVRLARGRPGPAALTREGALPPAVTGTAYAVLIALLTGVSTGLIGGL